MGFIRHFRGLPLMTSGSPPSPLTTKLRRDDRLSTVSDMHVLDRNDLLAAGADTLQREQARLIRRRQARDRGTKTADFLSSMLEPLERQTR